MKDNLRLLIVDDDADDRQFFIEAAHEINETIHCVTAQDGQQAMILLSDKSTPLPDYIFLDLRMPKINGKKCLEKIKEDDRLNKIPVIIYTTSRELIESQELKNMGAAHFASKPTNPDEIYYLISLILEDRL